MINYIKTHRWLKVILIILMIIVIFALAVVLFLLLWPAFGRGASSEQKADYAARAENYYDGQFHYTEDFAIMGSYDDAYADRTSGKGQEPVDELPVVAPEFIENPEVTEFSVTWFGHSSTLLQMQGMSILFDPVFSEIASPVSFVGTSRFSGMALTAEELPHIDICIFSHDHYDHLDYPTVRAIMDKVDLFIVPLGVENHLERFGVDEEKIVELAWWEEYEVNGLTVACTPAKHYSGRKLIDQNSTLWASWVLKNDSYTVYESGDSGFGDHFEEIYERYGEFDLAMLDCAQYNGAWHDVHMFPEESIEAAQVLKAKVAMPIHWGAFTLANHSWDDPVERFVLNAAETGQTVVTPMLGETVLLDNLEEYQDTWWHDYQ